MGAFDEVREQIQWAESRIELARVEIVSYLQNDAFRFEREADPKTGEIVQKVRLIKEVPASIKGYLRNAVIDLKHAFDMSLHAAASTLGPVTFDKNFPWADTPKGVKTRIDKWQGHAKTRLPEVLVDEIFRQQPHGTGEGFSGGDDMIREIAKMANNKHSIGITAQAVLNGVSVERICSGSDGAFTLGGHWDSQKKEMEISRHQGSVSYQNPTVSGNIFFERTGLLTNVPAIPATVAFADRAKKSLEGFEGVASRGAA